MIGVDPFTDSAIAVAACSAILRDRFIHVHGLGWMAYDGSVWREVPTRDVREALRDWAAERLLAAAADYAAGTGTKDDVKGWTRWQQTSRLLAAVTLCEGLLAVHPSKLDAHPDLLNCTNGVVDLKTGQLLPSMPWYYFTKVTGTHYDPKAEHPDWGAALKALPDSVVTWLQIRFGQAATGHMTPDDRVVVQQGGGENGKSTVIGGVSSALGDYYLQASEKILLPTGNSNISAEVADLRGARLVAIEETAETGRLDVQRLKAISGTPRITARKLYKDPITFDASHSMFLNTNFTPIVNENDHGTWRRLWLVVYPYRFTAHPLEPDELPGDPQLRSRLLTELPQRAAVLAWVVAGAVAWYAAGKIFPPAPPIVDADTAEWRGQTDHVAMFWDEYLEPFPDYFITVSDMVAVFNEFMRRRGNSGLAEGTFSRRFKDHPRTVESKAFKTTIRLSDRQRPFMSRVNSDEWKQLPQVPNGVVKAWRGVRFTGLVDRLEVGS